MIERVRARTTAEVRAAYNAHYREHDFGDGPRLYRRVIRMLGAPERARVLDVGCGSGPFVRAALAAGLRPIGIDVSDEALRRARAALPDPDAATLVLAAGEALPFADGSFEWLVNLGNLEHFVDPAAGVAETVRVLAPGGRAIVMLPNSYSSGDIWRVITTGRGPDHHQINDRFATRGEWQELLEGGGLEVVSVHRHEKPRLLKAWRWLLPLNLAYHFIFVCRRP